MNKDEALRLALEAMVYHTEQTRPIHKTTEAIAAIRAALVEAVDTPEGCVDEKQKCGHEPVDNKDWQKVSYIRERLDKEVEEFTKEQQDRFATAFDEAFAKMGLPQKQEVEPVKREPIGIVVGGLTSGGFIVEPIKRPVTVPLRTPLYTTPQPRQDVDLTDDEIGELIMPVKPIMEFARAVIAAYKEKQNANS